ncbi:MAG: hypothetical protein BWK79_15025, partial [Beggiatoa sp. IS2]
NHSSIAIQALLAFLQVSNTEELAVVFLEHPELLEEEIDPVFEEVIEKVRMQGESEQERVQLFMEHHQMLKNARPTLNELIAQHQNENSSKDVLQKALIAAIDTELLLIPARAFLQTSNEEEIGAVFQRYPELLEAEESDHIFEALVENALKYDEDELAKLFAERFQELKDIRMKLKKVIAQQQAPGYHSASSPRRSSR